MTESNKNIQEFLQSTCNQIRFKSAHKSISNELSDHIEEQKKEYINQGYDEETAVVKAIEQMGDPVLVGKQLDNAHRPKTEWSILLLSAVLVVIGGMFQFFLSRVNANNAYVFSNFLIYAPIGIVAFIATYFFNYTLIGRYSKLTYGILFAITIAGFFLLHRVNGTYPHAYYAILLFVPAFAGIVYGLRNRGYLGIIACGFFYGGAAYFCFIGPRLAGLILFTISCLAILTIAIMKGYFRCNKKVGLAIVYVPSVLAAILPVLLLILSDHGRGRILTLINPERDPFGRGYHQIMVKRLIEASRPFGEAILDGRLSKMRIDQILPGWATDFSLTYIIARLGYAAGVAIVAIIFILIIRMFISIFKQENAFGFLLSCAAGIALTGQFTLYILSNIGALAPFSGTLPFISFGGMGFITNMILLGIVLSVHRRTNLVFDKLHNTVYNKQLFTFEDGKIIIDLGVKYSKDDK
ncbi:MAG: FtsW/RodA/SpoVE family cell cycle protein [Bacillota bacterium]|nr:FtsW/RodA/SpoVE family cell cycle protein [Bacillota bacterium]